MRGQTVVLDGGTDVGLVGAAAAPEQKRCSLNVAQSLQ
jgi:hypothetical protein